MISMVSVIKDLFMSEINFTSHNFNLYLLSELATVFSDPNPKDPQALSVQLMSNQLELTFIKAPAAEKLEFLKMFRAKVEGLASLVNTELALIDDETKTLEQDLSLAES